jgi:para-nitrobenzyl esterase
MSSAATAVVTTTSGPVRGTRAAHGSVFLGVPYAAAPTGPHRFGPPRPHPGWTDVRDATTPGPTAPQPNRDAFGTLDMSPYFGPGWRRGDDYLTVDIWAPHPRHHRAPVMVFVHGGGFTAGSTGAPLYDGTAFARDGVVLVTVNHRLGIHGFLHLPDAPDNRGMLDVLAALHFVRDNAASFGGDPDTITLFGQSAGAIIVAGILAHHADAGLIRRAIMQSGNGAGAFTPEQAAIVTTAVGDRLGADPTAQTLADIPDERLVDAIPRLPPLDLRTPTHHDPLGGITPFSLVLTRQPTAAIADGAGDIDLLIGSNSNEGNLYLAPHGLLTNTTDADVHATAARFHDHPRDVVDAYRRCRPAATDADLRAAILGDGLFGAGTRRMAAAHAMSATAATYAYEFTWRSDALGGQLGASHVMELPFVFDLAHLSSLHGPRSLLGTAAPPADLAARMHAAWVRFAATGDPGWPATSPRRNRVQQIGATWQLVDEPGSWNDGADTTTAAGVRGRDQSFRTRPAEGMASCGNCSTA